MRKLAAIILGFNLLVATVGGCRSGIPAIGDLTVQNPLRMPAVPGQTEPEIDDAESD